MASVLRHRHFRNVWIAAFGSSIGTWMESVGVQWIMAEQTRSAGMAGWLAAAQFGPVLVLGLFAGVVADRANRKRLLVVTQGVMMAVAAMLMLASWRGFATPRVLIALGLCQGVASAFNIPAWQVLTPRLVPREELVKAITLNGMQFNMARVIGPMIAGYLLAMHGPTVLFVVNTLSFVGVMVAVSFTPRDDARDRAAGVRAQGWWGPIREGVAWVVREPGPRAVFVGLILYSVLAVPVIRFLPLLTKEAFHREERVYGWLVSLLGAGAVAGGFLLRSVPAWYPRHHLIPASIALCGVALLGFSAAPLWAAYGMMFVVGVFWLWTFTSSLGAMQMLAPETMRGRVLSICNTATFGATPVGTLLAGWLGAAAVDALRGPGAASGADAGLAMRAAVGVPAAIMVAAGAVMLVWRVPEVDGIKPGDAGYDRRPGLWRGLTASGHRPRGAAAQVGASAGEAAM